MCNVNHVQVDEEWQSPNLTRERKECQFTKDLSCVGDCHHSEHMEHSIWNGEQIGIESAKAKPFECEGQVLCWRRHWYLEGEPNEVHWNTISTEKMSVGCLRTYEAKGHNLSDSAKEV